MSASGDAPTAQSGIVGFVGLGAIGAPMARRLAQAGRQLVVHDLDPSAAAAFAAEGAIVVGSAAEVADRAETVLSSLPSGAALEAVATGEAGVVKGSAVRQFVDLSTVGAEATRKVAATLAEGGIACIDSPVSGGVAAAARGALSLMVACETAQLAGLRDLLAALGTIYHVGEQPGMGQTMKVLNNFLSATALAATSEAMVFGVKMGLDPEVMIDVLNASSGRNTATEQKFPQAVLPRTFDYGFSVQHMHKDVGLFRDEAEAVEVPLEVCGAVYRVWSEALESLGGDVDITAVVQVVERPSGVEVRGTVRPATTNE